MRVPARKPMLVLASALAMGGSLAVSMISPSTPAQAQMAVFDPRNYAQNILIAARTLQSVNQQIQQLQNEAQMLANQGKNLARIDFPQLDGLTARLAQIDSLMGRASNIDFHIDEINTQFARAYPEDFKAALTTDARVRDARGRLDASMAGYRHTMTVQAGVVESIHEDAEALKQIALRSQGAEGSLQAQQATNQLLALTAKQQMQLQHLMAAQFRSETTERARQATQSLEARAATRKFLGSGSAYTPK